MLGLPWSKVSDDAATLSHDLRLVPLVRFADSVQPAFSSDEFDIFFDGRIFTLGGAGRFLLGLCGQAREGLLVRCFRGPMNRRAAGCHWQRLAELAYRFG